ncbi:hypothetical protein LG309_14725 [Stutzerimonas chloritidismutans]|uniref:hypothetical protein n=1 Tax=Stutzerimonas chloritidismutans TaxID=203192 RepID=UPI00384B03AD
MSRGSGNGSANDCSGLRGISGNGCGYDGSGGLRIGSGNFSHDSGERLAFGGGNGLGLSFGKGNASVLNCCQGRLIGECLAGCQGNRQGDTSKGFTHSEFPRCGSDGCCCSVTRWAATGHLPIAGHATAPGFAVDFLRT